MYVAISNFIFQNMQTFQSAAPSTFLPYGPSSHQQPSGTESNEILRSDTVNSVIDSRNPYYSYQLFQSFSGQKSTSISYKQYSGISVRKPTYDLYVSYCRSNVVNNPHQAESVPSSMYYNNNTNSTTSTTQPPTFPNSASSPDFMDSRSYYLSYPCVSLFSLGLPRFPATWLHIISIHPPDPVSSPLRHLLFNGPTRMQTAIPLHTDSNKPTTLLCIASKVEIPTVTRTTTR